VRVRTPDPARLATALAGPGISVTVLDDGGARVEGLAPDAIGNAAAAAGIPLYEIVSLGGTLEDAYMALTAGEVEYRSSAAAEVNR
ncbi:MAG TPA: ABC transporter ATP-binding protein, partial [Glaciihabitans sp.]|nr:ABC transporter ATP-binding protein [Glaciihabitans sp.]